MFQHGLPVAKVLHCHCNLLQPAISVRAPCCSCIWVSADTTEVSQPRNAKCCNVCARSYEHVMHFTDTSLRLGSVQASKTASSIRQEFAKVAKAAIMDNFCWTDNEGKEKGWDAAPILPPVRRKKDNFLVSARAQRLLKGAQYQCTQARWWFCLLWHLHKNCRSCCGVMRHLMSMTVSALF